MKNIFSLTFLLLIISSSIFGQAPESFSYQAIIRDSNAKILAHSSIDLKIYIIESSVNGTVVYSELHKLLTNQFI